MVCTAGQPGGPEGLETCVLCRQPLWGKGELAELRGCSSAGYSFGAGSPRGQAESRDLSECLLSWRSGMHSRGPRGRTPCDSAFE